MAHTAERSAEDASVPPQPMTLDEARQARWLASYPRTLGDLMDEGYLTRSRLTWAITKAHDPRLRQAAQVIYEVLEKREAGSERSGSSSAISSVPKVTLDITLAQARATLWPFREHKGRQMGELIDTAAIGSRDLAYAVEAAYEPRVKQAALALLLHRLNQSFEERPRKGPAKVISGGRSYMLRRQFELILMAGALAGTFLGAAAVLAVWSFVGTAQARSSAPLPEYRPEVIAVALLLIVVLGAVAYWLSQRVAARLFREFQRRIDRLRQGQEGEDRVIEAILPALDDRWTLFRNISLPGRHRADLDVVLVGPGGMWLLEIKAYRGTYRTAGKHWETYVGGRWRSAHRNPSVQARSNASALSEFLKRNGAQVWIEPVVVWANPNAPLVVTEPETPVWTLESLRDEVGNLYSINATRPDTLQRATAILTRLCEDAVSAQGEEST